jgi:hypothetical protein
LFLAHGLRFTRSKRSKRTNHSDALEFWKQFAGKTNLTREDLRDEATVALASDEIRTADSGIKNLFAGSRAVSGSRRASHGAVSYLEKCA